MRSAVDVSTLIVAGRSATRSRALLRGLGASLPQLQASRELCLPTEACGGLLLPPQAFEGGSEQQGPSAGGGRPTQPFSALAPGLRFAGGCLPGGEAGRGLCSYSQSRRGLSWKSFPGRRTARAKTPQTSEAEVLEEGRGREKAVGLEWHSGGGQGCKRGL